MNEYETLMQKITSPADGSPIPQEYLIVNVLVYGLALLATSVLFFQILVQWWKNPGNRSTLIGVVIICFALLLRMVVSFTDRVVDMEFNGTRELAYLTLFQTIPWLLLYFGLHFILLRLIKVPKRRQNAYKRITRLNITTIAVLLIVVGLSFFPSGDVLAGLIASLGLLLVTIFLWIMVFQIKKEAEHNSSKLVVIRLKMLALGNLMIAISFAMVPFVIILAIVGLLGPALSIAVTLTTAILTVAAQYMFYGAFFVPAWMKKRHGLVMEASLI